MEKNNLENMNKHGEDETCVLWCGNLDLQVISVLPKLLNVSLFLNGQKPGLSNTGAFVRVDDASGSGGESDKAKGEEFCVYPLQGKLKKVQNKIINFYLSIASRLAMH